MIPFDFEYHKPASIQEAASLHQELSSNGLAPVYYGGGTEIITGARLRRVHMNAVIDIKGIPECQEYAAQMGKVVVGSAITLSRLQEKDYFPLLNQTASRAADRTTRNKITVGGNICGHIIFRETVLPYLLTDSTVVIAGPKGIRSMNINDIFIRNLQLDKGEFLVQIWTEMPYTTLPFVSVKRTKNSNVAYPLVTLAAIKTADKIRVALSGVCAFPFRSQEMETSLNNPAQPIENRVEAAIRRVPAPIISNVEGSSDYRTFVLRNELIRALMVLDRR